MQFDQAPDGTPHAAAQARASTPAPASSASSPCCRASTRSGTPTCSGRSSPRPSRSPASRYGAVPTATTDVSLRILAEHARTMTFLVTDGVVPVATRSAATCCAASSAARCATRTCSAPSELVTPALVDATVDVMGNAYPDAREAPRLHHERGHAARRSASARRCERGLRPPRRRARRPGDVAGRATRSSSTTRYGFPLELTARDRGGARPRRRPRRASTREMAEQRSRAKEAHKAAGGDGERRPIELYRELARAVRRRPSSSAARSTTTEGARCSASSAAASGSAAADAGDAVERRSSTARRSTPSRGGQVGDTGDDHHRGRRDRGRRSLDTHVRAARPAPCTAAEVDRGRARRGRRGRRRDRRRRAATRSAATTPRTHLLHWALREVLGAAREAGRLAASRPIACASTSATTRR